jgi:hypothetical protein
VPRVILELPEVYESIARPVAMDITRTVGRIMHLPSETEILFAGNTGQALQAGATINYAGAPAKLPSGSRIQVQMTEGTEETNILSENGFQENQPVCWHDRCLGARLRPIYSSVVMTLRFEVQSRNRTEAEKLRDEFRMRTAMGRQQLLHSVIYHYGIPVEQFQLLQDIYALREAVAGYGDTFDAWLRKHEVRPPNTLPRLTQISNMAGSGLSYVFGERQVSIQGTFDFHVAPEAPDKNDPTGMYTYPIEYRVRYDKPIGMSMDYPLVVHNQLLPDKYYGKKSVGGWIPDPYTQGTLYSDKTTEIFRKMILNYTLRNRRLIGGVRYPAFDDWIPNAVPAHTSTIYAAMIAVDLTNPTAVCDLKQLEGVVIDGDIRQYMASCGSKMGQINNSAIHISLYQGNGWMGDGAISVSNDLIVTATQPLSARERYHLRIAVLNDLTLLPDQVRYNLRTQGKACQKILQTLQETMPFANYVPKLMGPRNVMPDDLLLQAAWRINAHKKPIQTPLEIAIPLTVGNFLVQARRMSEYAPDAAGSIPAAPVPLNDNPNYESLVPGCGEQHQSNAGQ